MFSLNLNAKEYRLLFEFIEEWYSFHEGMYAAGWGAPVPEETIDGKLIDIFDNAYPGAWETGVEISLNGPDIAYIIQRLKSLMFENAIADDLKDRDTVETLITVDLIIDKLLSVLGVELYDQD